MWVHMLIYVGTHVGTHAHITYTCNEYCSIITFMASLGLSTCI